MRRRPIHGSFAKARFSCEFKHKIYLALLSLCIWPSVTCDTGVLTLFPPLLSHPLCVLLKVAWGAKLVTIRALLFFRRCSAAASNNIL